MQEAVPQESTSGFERLGGGGVQHRHRSSWCHAFEEMRFEGASRLKCCGVERGPTKPRERQVVEKFGEGLEKCVAARAPIPRDLAEGFGG